MRAKFSGRVRKLWVVLPARGVGQGKSRLAPVLDIAARTRLNRWLLKRTLGIIARWQGSLCRCIVVSSCAQTLLIAKRAHALALTEPRPGRGLDRAVDHAVGEAIRQGARRVLVLPSDLPTLSVAALDALAVRAVAGNHCVIAPDSARTGTNALLLNARGRFAFSYGPGSCARHVEASRSRGWGVSVCVHPALALDIDTPHDLAVWIGSGSTLPRLQPMTLARISHVERRSSRSPVSIATDRART